MLNYSRGQASVVLALFRESHLSLLSILQRRRCSRHEVKFGVDMLLLLRLLRLERVDQLVNNKALVCGRAVVAVVVVWVVGRLTLVAGWAADKHSVVLELGQVKSELVGLLSVA